MAMSTDVTLPRNYAPQWPEKCLVCHCEPDATTKIVSRSQNSLASFFLPVLFLFGWSRIEIPVCQSCKFRFYSQRWYREALCWIFVITAVWLIMPHFQNLSRLYRRIVVGVLVVVAISPYLILEVIWPRILDTMAGESEICYEFASEDYAAEFRNLNRHAIISSDFD